LSNELLQLSGEGVGLVEPKCTIPSKKIRDGDSSSLVVIDQQPFDGGASGNENKIVQMLGSGLLENVEVLELLLLAKGNELA
jgi:hypothetical protein